MCVHKIAERLKIEANDPQLLKALTSLKATGRIKEGTGVYQDAPTKVYYIPPEPMQNARGRKRQRHAKPESKPSAQR